MLSLNVSFVITVNALQWLLFLHFFPWMKPSCQVVGFIHPYLHTKGEIKEKRKHETKWGLSPGFLSQAQADMSLLGGVIQHHQNLMLYWVPVEKNCFRLSCTLTSTYRCMHTRIYVSVIVFLFAYMLSWSRILFCSPWLACSSDGSKESWMVLCWWSFVVILSFNNFVLCLLISSKKISKHHWCSSYSITLLKPSCMLEEHNDNEIFNFQVYHWNFMNHFCDVGITLF